MDIIGHLADGDVLHLYGWSIPLPGFPPVDMSVTRVVLMMWLAGLLTWFFIERAAAGNPKHPKGLHNFVEVVTLFIRNEIVLPYMHKEGLAFLPFFVTLFFFILFMNLIGLLPPPFGQTPTGSISVTAALALVSFVLIQFVGIRKYGPRRHFLNLFPPVPFWLLPIIVPVELLGVLTKPFALAIRLFANMTAGHCMILAFIGFIFMARDSLAVWPVAGVISITVLCVFLLEVLVGTIQAYVFVFLTAVFMGQTLHAEH